MSVPIKPHSVSVKQVTQAIDATSKLRGNAHPGGTSIVVTCNVQRLRPDAAFKEIGIETDNAIKIFIETSDATTFTLNAEITFGGAKYAVVAEPEIHDAGDIVDHAVVYAQGLQYGKP